MIRALSDTNVLISYLLHPAAESPPARFVRAGIAGAFTLLVTPRVLNELRTKVESKPYLATHIPDLVLARFLDVMIGHTHHIIENDLPYPAITRDRKDDFLIAHAIFAHADYLVSGDPDLLVLEEFESVRIVGPAEFVQIPELNPE